MEMKVRKGVQADRKESWALDVKARAFLNVGDVRREKTGKKGQPGHTGEKGTGERIRVLSGVGFLSH